MIGRGGGDEPLPGDQAGLGGHTSGSTDLCGLSGRVICATAVRHCVIQGGDKRNRNPNWTDAEITRFLMILMEEPVLNDLNAQRNKQVIQNYVLSSIPPSAGVLLRLP